MGTGFFHLLGLQVGQSADSDHSWLVLGDLLVLDIAPHPSLPSKHCVYCTEEEAEAQELRCPSL